MFQTPEEAAEALFGAIPHAITPAVLEEYGIEAAGPAHHITRELLSLSLFRIHWALQAVLPPKHREQVLAALHRRVVAGWEKDLWLEGSELEFFDRVAEQRKTYTQAMQAGAGPVDIAHEAAALLVSHGAVPAEDRQKVLGLIIDLVPDTELVELVEQLKSAE